MHSATIKTRVTVFGCCDNTKAPEVLRSAEISCLLSLLIAGRHHYQTNH